MEVQHYFFSKNEHHIVYRKRPPRIVNRTVPKIIVISVHTVNRFPITSYQVSVHLTKRFQRRRFKKNWPIKNKNCLWWPCLLTDRDEMCNLYRGPSIDAAYHMYTFVCLISINFFFSLKAAVIVHFILTVW
jgi:hypothetical protein